MVIIPGILSAAACVCSEQSYIYYVDGYKDATTTVRYLPLPLAMTAESRVQSILGGPLRNTTAANFTYSTIRTTSLFLKTPYALFSLLCHLKPIILVYLTIQYDGRLLGHIFDRQLSHLFTLC